MPTPPRGLIIDLDGVLRVWPDAVNARIEAATGLPSGALLKAAFSGVLDDVITGRISDAQWRAQIAQRLRDAHPGADADEAVRRWSGPVGELQHDVLGMVRACRERVPVALLSNATSRLRADLARLGIADAFDAIVNTSEHGFAKPDPRIFRVALEALALPAEDAMFVDDSASHVAAAQALGIRAHHFKSAAGLRAALREAGFEV